MEEYELMKCPRKEHSGFTWFFPILLLVFSSCGDPSRIDCSQIFTGSVCGVDGNTYQNDCFAEQAGIFVYLNGACPYSPCSGTVCGSDETTYPSDCFAFLSGVNPPYEDGECPPPPE